MVKFGIKCSRDKDTFCAVREMETLCVKEEVLDSYETPETVVPLFADHIEVQDPLYMEDEKVSVGEGHIEACAPVPNNDEVVTDLSLGLVEETHTLHTEDEKVLRATPVQRSVQSDDSSYEDEEDGHQHSPSHCRESPEHEAEDNEEHTGYEIHRGGDASRYCKATESPVMSRRGVQRSDAAMGHFNANREYKNTLYDSSEFYQRPNVVNTSVIIPNAQYSNLTIVLIVVILIGSGISYNLFPESNGTVDLKDLMEVVRDALSKFENIPRDIAFQLSAGIRNTLESDPNRPSSFVILHDEPGQAPYCLAEVMANISIKHLNSGEETPLVLKPDELLKDINMTEDYGWIIENYSPLVEKHRSVIVSELHKLPGKMAMAFHFFCDADNPVVPKSLFVFTLQVSNGYCEKKMEQVEKTMHKMWAEDIPEDQLQALVTSLTANIIYLPSDILLQKGCM